METGTEREDDIEQQVPCCNLFSHQSSSLGQSPRKATGRRGPWAKRPLAPSGRATLQSWVTFRRHSSNRSSSQWEHRQSAGRAFHLLTECDSTESPATATQKVLTAIILQWPGVMLIAPSQTLQQSWNSNTENSSSQSCYYL